jgi:hypothetical protein
MKKSPYFFEIKNLLIQFLAAFNNVVIKRFNSEREVGQTIQVRYVYAPKERVIYDIVNQSQNITLPVVSINMRSFSRDNNRVFNKSGGFYKPSKDEKDKKKGDSEFCIFYRTPVPVNIEIDMSIMTKYQTDLDQIMSNFIPFCNPYVILSWKVPEEYNMPFVEEIRSEVLWGGNISVEYPKDIAGNTKYHIIGNTSFTIKGWIFPAVEDPVKNVFFIDSALSLVGTGDSNFRNGEYFSLSANVIETGGCYMYHDTSITSISASPKITDVNVHFTP